MIHEVLIFLSNPSNGTEMALLEDLQSFMHPGERELVKKIMEIASHHQSIGNFCQKQSSNSAPLSIYRKALANGCATLLTDYRQDIVKLEDMFLQNPQLPLVFIRGYLDKYLISFEIMKRLMDAIERDKIHGCMLLGKVHMYVKCGISPISKCADKIIESINVIFYRQLSNWIIHGDLIDEHQEFFICDGKCPDEDFLYPEQIEELSNGEGIVLKKLKIQRPPVVRKFYINWNMVPTFIKKDTVENILFMGRIVWILGNDPKKKQHDKYDTKCKRDIWNGEANEYFAKIQNLGDSSFNPFQFELAIGECRSKLTQYLWSVMLEEGHLKDHLQLIREYYALGRGELFNQFIAVAENNIKDPTTKHLSHKLNFVFQETARKIYGENDKSHLRFELSIAQPDVGCNLWSQVQLNFEISWPLHIIFHPKSMSLYNQLFTYLMRLKRTQLNLNTLWKMHAATKQNIDRRVWTLRQHLTFLVNNLQYLLQVDVIETEFSVLLKAIESAVEFEYINKVHHEFISNLLSKSFILIPDERRNCDNTDKFYETPAVNVNVHSKVYNVIMRLLGLCDDFCLVAQTWDIELSDPEVLELKSFQEKTDEVVDSLLFILYSVHQKSSGHSLELLHQLDFNHFFSRSRPDLNLTTVS